MEQQQEQEQQQIRLNPKLLHLLVEDMSTFTGSSIRLATREAQEQKQAAARNILDTSLTIMVALDELIKEFGIPSEQISQLVSMRQEQVRKVLAPKE